MVPAAAGKAAVDPESRVHGVVGVGVVAAWEHAARAAEDLGVRVVLARTAPIVAPEALDWRLRLLPFRLVFAGPLASGRHRLPRPHASAARLKRAVAYAT